jgi:hypothetical protein
MRIYHHHEKSSDVYSEDDQEILSGSVFFSDNDSGPHREATQHAHCPVTMTYSFPRVRVQVTSLAATTAATTASSTSFAVVNKLFPHIPSSVLSQ